MSFLKKLKNKVLGKENKEEYLSGFKRTSDNFTLGADQLQKKFKKVILWI